MSIPTMLSIALSLAGALLVAPAQDSAAAAQAELKSAAKAIIKNTEGDLALARDAAFDAIKSFDDAVKVGNFGADAFHALEGSLFDFQDAVSKEMLQAATGLRDAVVSALAAHGPFAGKMPAGFSPGDGGTWDATRAAVSARADKTVELVRKKLRASSKKLVAQAGVPLFVLMETPQMPEVAASEAGSGGYKNRVNIDLVVSAGGRIALAGDAPWVQGVVSLLVTTIDGFLKFEMTLIEPNLATDRFRISTIDAQQSAPFAPGVYGLRVKQGTLSFDAVTIGAQ